MEMKIDDRRGLPAPPEGHYWRVKGEIGPNGVDRYISVLLMNENGRIRARLSARTLFGTLLAYTKVRPRHIRYAARAILVSIKSDEFARTLEGDYRP